MENTQTVSSSPKKFKLDLKRTFLIGFAFFGILLLWQVYDSWCPTLLTDIFARNVYHLSSAELQLAEHQEKLLNVQWIVGIIMACDNLAALILLPIFGNLSDKTKTPIGKRMPYILVGTFVSAIAFPFIPLFFHMNQIAGMVICMAIVLIFMMMYRNPAVALMPDITPKPIRAKANGIINIMGYLGGACATVLGLFLVLSNYIKADDATRNLWTIELPFIIASVLMVVSAIVLFFTVNENKLALEMKDEMERGEKEVEIEEAVDDEKPMPKANKIMLWGILIAEFLWFMCDNAIGTYIGNFIIYYLKAASSNNTILTIVGGVASVAGFATAGFIADKLTRKWTISIGLALYIIGAAIFVVVGLTSQNPTINPETGYASLPVLMFVVWIVKGYGIALVNTCSFPMVVELCSSKKIGKFTGYYYASSMAAQTVTPVLLGLLFNLTKAWWILPIYCTVLIAASFAVFTPVVKSVNPSKVANVKGLEALGGDD
ncbi:MAG: MFS transporter [Bacilli bacterium]|nr:MFS transporter [Bacilli bacterium]